MGLRERMAKRLQDKMTAPIAAHLEPGEHVDMRPTATVEFQGQRATCSLYLTDRAIYMVVADTDVVSRILIPNVVAIPADPPTFALKWVDPSDGSFDGMLVTIMPAMTAALFVVKVRAAYERLTGTRLGEQSTSEG